MSGLFVRLVVSASVLVVAVPTLAHDSWISRGALRNAAGEWCCGEGDCFNVPGNQVNATPAGYRLLLDGEMVPYSEAQPSPDGEFWRCKRPDVSRRCFFAPPATN